jgi:hypothetical protein
MRDHHTRLAKLETLLGMAPELRHFVSMVKIPRELPGGMEEDTWLRTEVTCACGQQGCPEMRLGFVLPEKSASPSEWEAETRQFYHDHPMGRAKGAGDVSPQATAAATGNDARASP